MGWAVGVFGGLLVYAAFADPTFRDVDKFGGIIGAVLIVAALLYQSRKP